MALRVASWNAGGLKARCRNKEFVQLAQSYDIIAIQETLARSGTRQVSIPGFQVFKRDAVYPGSGRPIGGLAIFISFSLLNSYKVDVHPVDDCVTECLLLKFSRLPTAQVSLPGSFFVLNLYVTPHPAPSNYPGEQKWVAGSQLPSRNGSFCAER